MIELSITCDRCGAEFKHHPKADSPERLTLEWLKSCLEYDGWIVQLNGENIDTYCSKECAR